MEVDVAHEAAAISFEYTVPPYPPPSARVLFLLSPFPTPLTPVFSSQPSPLFPSLPTPPLLPPRSLPTSPLTPLSVLIATFPSLNPPNSPNSRPDSPSPNFSPPGYYFRPGFGNGSSSWHVHWQYGGWCSTQGGSRWRSHTWLGSSNETQQNQNPWNFRQCPQICLSLRPFRSPPPPVRQGTTSARDSATAAARGTCTCSTAGGATPWGNAGGAATRGSALLTRLSKTRTPGNSRIGVTWTEGVYLDGWKIIKAVLTDVTDYKGLKTASQVLLSGVSAGGEAVVTLCDQLPALVPSAKTTKCLMDSGFFLDSLDVNKQSAFRRRIKQVAELHDFIGNPRCSRATNETKKWRCFFPEYSLPFVRSPFFILNSLFDVKALTLGNELPASNMTYAYECLQEIMDMPNLRQSIPSTPYKDLAFRNTNRKCTLPASRAVLAYSQKMWTTIGYMEDKKLKAFLAWSNKHGIMVDGAWATMKEKGVFLRDAVANWYFS
ncbi:unnamed protein product [Closterium sp. NIES-54]